MTCVTYVEFSYPYHEDSEIDKCIEYMSGSLIRYNSYDEVVTLTKLILICIL